MSVGLVLLQIFYIGMLSLLAVCMLISVAGACFLVCSTGRVLWTLYRELKEADGYEAI